ncbi:gag-pol polyprotein [Cucumis melo var. makuwa]|uniref:Gag-pol polyprotein n=1 Tax=Cucumis melo var. makuwa TaxID=1194695 RepID=A0A5A7TSX9_CUCMM|nr:gag-pol polyprotein [Cucumis melo var. makuwa]
MEFLKNQLTFAFKDGPTGGYDLFLIYWKLNYKTTSARWRNYGYWKARMAAFLMSLDMRCRRAIIVGWEHPTETDEAGKVIRKSELKWLSTEDDVAIGNSSKEAWDILEVAYEGTSEVKMSQLQILTSWFKALKMLEEEPIAEFNVRVLDIMNETDALEEKMSDAKLVRKVLRSLPPRFNMKITAIEEVNDMSRMKLDELFGSLRTFELHLGEGSQAQEPIPQACWQLEGQS